jgi:hypothetical protein
MDKRVRAFLGKVGERVVATITQDVAHGVIDWLANLISQM